MRDWAVAKLVAYQPQPMGKKFHCNPCHLRLEADFGMQQSHQVVLANSFGTCRRMKSGARARSTYVGLQRLREVTSIRTGNKLNR